MCGVFGIRAPERDVARVTFFGLFALQHRGQESAGIAVSDGGRLTVLRDMGLVAQVFDEQNLSGLQGEVAIGHTRYSTTGSTQWTNAQPIVQHGRTRTVTLGHNGNLTNTQQLRDELAAEEIMLSTTSDTEVIAALIANDPAPLEDAIANTMRRLDGAYTIVALAEGKLIGFRDPFGFRPLNLGSIDGDPVLASETCALDLVGAKHEREVAPGVPRPAADDGHRGERRPVRLDHFLAGGGAHALGAGLGDVEQVAELAELVEERAGHPEIEELRHPCGQLVEPLDAKRRRHALGRAEGVDEHRRRKPLHVFEEQGHVLLGGPLRDAIGDLGDLEVARDRCRHAAKLTALVEVCDELPEIGEGHACGPVTRGSRPSPANRRR